LSRLQAFPLEDLFAIFFGLASAATGLFVFAVFCVLRRDVRRCWRRPVCMSRPQQPRAYHDDFEDDRLLETSNLVHPANPPLLGQSVATGVNFRPKW
jgi:hypothetical protein